MAGNDNIKVIIKVRPLIKRERDAKQTSQWRVIGDCIECINPMNPGYRFVFDEICDETSSTHDLYEKVAKPIVQSTINGFNGTIFAYGQTSSGKTHTMMGNQAQPGITPLAIREIFSGIDHRQERSFLLKVTYIEIYNEKVYDLLNSRNEVKIQEQANGELHIERKEMIVTSEKCIMDLLNEGNNLRKVAETNMNVQSSRSHTIFSIMIESDEVNGPDNEEESATVVSMLNLVDLAGSERADATGATGCRFKEGSHINKSLLSLSLVINKLSEGQDQHINYRDSKLTRILQLSLGGNALTAIICTVTPAAVDETNYTLGFASRAKRVKNRPVINHVVSDALTLKKMKKQISALEEQLENERKQHLEYTEKEKRLNRLKDGILQYKSKSDTLVIPNRRKTWAPNMKPDSIDQLVHLRPKQTDIAATSSDNKLFKFSEHGHDIEYSDERFQSVLNASFTTQTPEFSVGRPPKARASLLKTPKSIRNILNRDRGDTPCNSALASPVTTVDKDKLIRRLEDELEELKYFQQTESTMRSADLQDIAELKKQLQEKAMEIFGLHEDTKKLMEEMSTLKASNQQCMDDLKAAKATMLQAEKAKGEAEQILSSVQFEHEQHVARASRREKELVEQLDRLRTDNGLAAMKEKLKIQSDALTKLESDYWLNERAHKEEIERLMEETAAAEEKSNKLVCEIFKFQTLQDDYDEVSAQLVDSVQDNDALKKRFDEQTVVVAELEKKISVLEAQLKDSIAIGDAKSEADVEKFQRKLDELEGIVSKLEKQCEQYAMENQKLSENLKAETQALTVESKLKNQLQAEVNELMAELQANDKLGELEAKFNEQKQSHEKEVKTLKAIESEMRQRLQAEVDDLLAKSSAIESLNQSLNALEAKLNEQKQSHEKEVETLRKIHEQMQNDLKESLEETEVICKELKFEIDELKSLNSILASERDESIKYCQEVMHENSMLSNACEHCRITVQFLNRELEVLRRTYTELQMNVAEQELGSLKLQKTICEINETSNISYLLETTDNEGQNQSVQSSRRSTLHKVRQSLGVLNEVVTSSPPAKLDKYEEKFQSIVDRLTPVIPDDGMDVAQIDYNCILDKLISIYHEFNAIVKYMEFESSHVDAQTIITLIQSLKNQTNDNEDAKLSLKTEIIAITDKCSQLENELEEAEEHLKSSKEIEKNHFDEINNLRREISELVVTRNESEAAYEAIAEKCLQLEREKKEFEEQIKFFTENSQIKREQFDELQRQFNDNKERLNQLESDELKSLRGKLSETENSLSNMRANVERRDEEMAILKKEHQKFIAIANYMDIESSDDDVQMVIASIKSLKDQTNDTENAKQSLKTEIIAITDKCIQLENQLKEAEEHLKSSKEIEKNHIDEINNLRREISELVVTRNESEAAYEAIAEKCLQFEREKKEFEEQIKFFTENSQIQRDQFDELQRQFNDNKERLNQLESDELKSLRGKLSQTENSLSNMRANVERRDEEMAILKKEHQKFIAIANYMDIESSDDDVQMVIASIKSLKDQTKDTENAKQLLETGIGTITNKCSQLESQLKKAEERLESLSEIDKNHLDEINNLKREIGELQAKLGESEVAYAALSEKCLQLDLEKNEFGAQIESLTQNSQIQLDEFNELRKQFNQNKEHLNQLLEKEKESDQLGFLQEKLIETEYQLNTMRMNVDNRNEEISIFKKKIEEFNDISKCMDIEFCDVNAQMVIAFIQSLQNQTKNTENAKHLLESEIQAITNACSQLKSQLKEAEERLESLGAIDKNHLDEINNLKREISELMAKRGESDVAYQALNEKCQQFEHDKNDYEAQMKSLTQSNQTRLDQFNELHQQLLETENAKQLLESEIRSITNKCTQVETELKETKEHLKSLGDIDKNRLDEVNNLKRVVGELMAKRDEYEVAYKAHSEKCLQFDREKTECQEQIKSSLRNNQIQLNQFNELQRQFNENKERLNQLEKHSVELKSVQQKLIETESELSAMRVNINIRNEEIAILKGKLQEKPKNRLIDTQTTRSPKPSRSSMSPLGTGKTARELDDLRNENNKLKSVQRSLENELQDLRRSSHQVRKIKRHSTHDDTRRISGFDSCMIDIGTQTDPVSENCRCAEYCKQIDKLKEDIIIKEARYFTLKRDSGVDALNEEVARLKSTLTTTKSDLNTTKANLDRLTDKYNTLKLKSCMTLIKAPRVEVSVQTDDSEYSSSGRTFSGEMDLQRANERSEKYKKAYAAKQNEFVEVKAALEKFKLDVTKENERKATEAVLLKRKLDDVSAKYSDVKLICNHRLEELESLNEKLKKTDAELALLKKKYDKVKAILMSRTTELEELKQKNQRLQASTGTKNNENVPNNF